VVFGARVADDIASSLPPLPPTKIAIATPDVETYEPNKEAEQTLRRTMSADVGVVRDAQSLTNALNTIVSLERDNEDDDKQFANMLTTAKLITAAALKRKESRGAHFRSDYPAPEAAQAKRSFITLTKADEIAREAASASSAPRLRAVSQA
jgi:L-aspartate oxidase